MSQCELNKLRFWPRRIGYELSHLVIVLFHFQTWFLLLLDPTLKERGFFGLYFCPISGISLLTSSPSSKMPLQERYKSLTRFWPLIKSLFLPILCMMSLGLQDIPWHPYDWPPKECSHRYPWLVQWTDLLYNKIGFVGIGALFILMSEGMFNDHLSRWVKYLTYFIL